MQTSRKNEEKLGVIGQHFLTSYNTEPQNGISQCFISFFSQTGTSRLLIACERPSPPLSEARDGAGRAMSFLPPHPPNDG